MFDYRTLTDEQIEKKIKELSATLESCPPCSNQWDVAYKEYMTLCNIQTERFKESNQDDFNAFYMKHIQGKTREEINADDWDFYSDWHKDMYGYRPHFIG